MVTFDFSDKVAVITGAASGIGFEIARQLISSGANVVVNDINGKLMQAALDLFPMDVGGYCPVIGDASQLEVVDTMVKQALENYGKLDYVIANAGITTFGKFLEYSQEDFHQLVSLNLQGSFFLAQRGAQQMILQESPGKILLMSSVTGHQAHPKLTAYGMTKAALEMLAKGLSVELASHHINVNAIAPGATMTERTEVLDEHYEEVWQKLTPLGRTATTNDIAKAALFLLSDAADHITGQTLIIDGGWTSVSPPPEDF